MSPLTPVGQWFSPHAGMHRQANVGGTLPARQGRSCQQQKRDHCGNRVAGQTEQKFFLASTKNKRAARPNRDFPELQFATHLFKSAFYEIHLTHRNAAGGYHGITFFERRFQRVARRSQSIWHQRENLRDSACSGHEC